MSAVADLCPVRPASPLAWISLVGRGDARLNRGASVWRALPCGLAHRDPTTPSRLRIGTRPRGSSGASSSAVSSRESAVTLRVRGIEGVGLHAD